MPWMKARACSMTCCGSEENARPRVTTAGFSGLMATSTTGARFQLMPASRRVAPMRRDSSAVAAGRGEPHDQAALVVGGDEERPARALAGEGLQVRGELAHLLGARDVARLAGAGVALEEDQPAHLHVAHERADLLVAFDLRAAESHEKQVPEGEGRGRWLARRAVRDGGGRAALDDQDQEESGETCPHRRPAARTSARTRSASTRLVTTPSRFTEVPTIRQSAKASRSAAFSGEAPLPTRSGTSGTARRTRSRSLVLGGSPVASPETISPSARPRCTQSRASCSMGTAARGAACLVCTSANKATGVPRRRR